MKLSSTGRLSHATPAGAQNDRSSSFEAYRQFLRGSMSQDVTTSRRQNMNDMGTHAEPSSRTHNEQQATRDLVGRSSCEMSSTPTQRGIEGVLDIIDTTLRLLEGDNSRSEEGIGYDNLNTFCNVSRVQDENDRQ